MSILSTVIVTFAIALLFPMPLAIVILFDETLKVKLGILASLMSRDETLGELRVYCEGNWMIMGEPAATSWAE